MGAYGDIIGLSRRSFTTALRPRLSVDRPFIDRNTLSSHLSQTRITDHSNMMTALKYLRVIRPEFQDRISSLRDITPESLSRTLTSGRMLEAVSIFASRTSNADDVNTISSIMRQNGLGEVTGTVAKATDVIWKIRDAYINAKFNKYMGEGLAGTVMRAGNSLDAKHLSDLTKILFSVAWGMASEGYSGDAELVEGLPDMQKDLVGATISSAKEILGNITEAYDEAARTAGRASILNNGARYREVEEKLYGDTIALIKKMDQKAISKADAAKETLRIINEIAKLSGGTSADSVFLKRFTDSVRDIVLLAGTSAPGQQTLTAVQNRARAAAAHLQSYVTRPEKEHYVWLITLCSLSIMASLGYISYRLDTMFTSGYTFTSHLASGFLFMAELFYGIMSIISNTGTIHALAKTKGNAGQSWLPKLPRPLEHSPEKRPAAAMFLSSFNEPIEVLRLSMKHAVRSVWHYGNASLQVLDDSVNISNYYGIMGTVRMARKMSAKRAIYEELAGNAGITNKEKARLIANNLASEYTEIDDPETAKWAVIRAGSDLARSLNIREKKVKQFGKAVQKLYPAPQDTAPNMNEIRDIAKELKIPDVKIDPLSKLVCDRLMSLGREANIASLTEEALTKGATSSKLDLIAALVSEEYDIDKPMARALIDTIVANNRNIDIASRAATADNDFLSTPQNQSLYLRAYSLMQKIFYNDERVNNVVAELQEKMRQITENQLFRQEKTSRYIRNKNTQLIWIFTTDIGKELAGRISRMKPIVQEIKTALAANPARPFEEVEASVWENRKKEIAAFISGPLASKFKLTDKETEDLTAGVLKDLELNANERRMAAMEFAQYVANQARGVKYKEERHVKAVYGIDLNGTPESIFNLIEKDKYFTPKKSNAGLSSITAMCSAMDMGLDKDISEEIAKKVDEVIRFSDPLYLQDPTNKQRLINGLMSAGVPAADANAVVDEITKDKKMLGKMNTKPADVKNTVADAFKNLKLTPSKGVPEKAAGMIIDIIYSSYKPSILSANRKLLIDKIMSLGIKAGNAAAVADRIIAQHDKIVLELFNVITDITTSVSSGTLPTYSSTGNIAGTAVNIQDLKTGAEGTVKFVHRIKDQKKDMKAGSINNAINGLTTEETVGEILRQVIHKRVEEKYRNNLHVPEELITKIDLEIVEELPQTLNGQYSDTRPESVARRIADRARNKQQINTIRQQTDDIIQSYFGPAAAPSKSLRNKIENIVHEINSRMALYETLQEAQKTGASDEKAVSAIANNLTTGLDLKKAALNNIVTATLSIRKHAGSGKVTVSQDILGNAVFSTPRPTPKDKDGFGKKWGAFWCGDRSAAAAVALEDLSHLLINPKGNSALQIAEQIIETRLLPEQTIKDKAGLASEIRKHAKMIDAILVKEDQRIRTGLSGEEVVELVSSHYGSGEEKNYLKEAAPDMSGLKYKFIGCFDGDYRVNKEALTEVAPYFENHSSYFFVGKRQFGRNDSDPLGKLMNTGGDAYWNYTNIENSLVNINGSWGSCVFHSTKSYTDSARWITETTYKPHRQPKVLFKKLEDLAKKIYGTEKPSSRAGAIARGIVRVPLYFTYNVLKTVANFTYAVTAMQVFDLLHERGKRGKRIGLTRKIDKLCKEEMLSAQDYTTESEDIASCIWPLRRMPFLTPGKENRLIKADNWFWNRFVSGEDRLFTPSQKGALERSGFIEGVGGQGSQPAYRGPLGNTFGGRWARGNIALFWDVMHTDLGFYRKLRYAASTMYWFTGVSRLALFTSPLLFMFLFQEPIRTAHMGRLVGAAGATFVTNMSTFFEVMRSRGTTYCESKELLFLEPTVVDTQAKEVYNGLIDKARPPFKATGKKEVAYVKATGRETMLSSGLLLSNIAGTFYALDYAVNLGGRWTIAGAAFWTVFHSWLMYRALYKYNPGVITKPNFPFPFATTLKDWSKDKFFPDYPSHMSKGAISKTSPLLSEEGGTL